MRFLDPSGRQQIGYLQLSEKIGYVQSEGVQQSYMGPGPAMPFQPPTGPMSMPTTMPMAAPQIEEKPNVQHKRIVNAFLSELASASKARHMDLLLVFQQYDTTKESCISIHDTEAVLSRLATFSPSQLDAAKREFSSKSRPGKFNYVQLVRNVEEQLSIVSLLDSAFAVFEKKMSDNNITNLYGLLGKWDLRNVRTFTSSDVEEIFSTLCKAKLKENELAAIVRRFDSGAGTADFVLIESDYQGYLNKKKEVEPTSSNVPQNALEILFASLKEVMAVPVHGGKPQKLANIFSKFDVTSGFMKGTNFQAAIKNVCVGKVSLGVLEEATKMLVNRQGEVDVFDFEKRFEKFKAESTSSKVSETQHALNVLADLLIQSKINLSNAIYERDSQRTKALPKDVLQKVVTATLKLDKETQSSLATLLDAYEKTRSGSVNYEAFLDDIARVTKERQLSGQFLSMLKAHLGIYKLRLEDLFRRADTQQSMLMTKEQVAKVIEQTKFRLENLPERLHRVLDSFPLHPGGKVEYVEFWKQVQAAPEYSVGPEKLEIMMGFIRKSVAQTRQKPARIIREPRHGKDGENGWT